MCNGQEMSDSLPQIRAFSVTEQISFLRPGRIVLIVAVAAATFPVLMNFFGSHFSKREWDVAALLFFGSLVVGVSHASLRRERHIVNETSTQATAEDQIRLQATALTSAANGIVITNCKGTIEWVNPAFTHITGFTPEEVLGKNPRVLKSGKHNEEFYNSLWSTISSGGVWHGEVTNRRKDGNLYTEEMTITPVVS